MEEIGSEPAAMSEREKSAGRFAAHYARRADYQDHSSLPQNAALTSASIACSQTRSSAAASVSSNTNSVGDLCLPAPSTFAQLTLPVETGVRYDSAALGGDTRGGRIALDATEEAFDVCRRPEDEDVTSRIKPR